MFILFEMYDYLMNQWKFRYRDQDVAADFSNLTNTIYVKEFIDSELIYEDSYVPSVIEFFQILDTAIDGYEERQNAQVAAMQNAQCDQDDIGF